MPSSWLRTPFLLSGESAFSSSGCLKVVLEGSTPGPYRGVLDGAKGRMILRGSTLVGIQGYRGSLLMHE